MYTGQCPDDMTEDAHLQNEVECKPLLPRAILANMYAVIGMSYCTGMSLRTCCHRLFDHNLTDLEHETLERMLPDG